MTGLATSLRPGVLAGAWFLHAVRHAGTGEAPWGARPDGMLLYGPDGRMTVMVTGNGRPGLGFAGRFRIVDDHVLHEVELCSGAWPSPGTVLPAVQDGDGLRMDTPASAGGPALQLSWRPVPPAWSSCASGLSEPPLTRRVVTANDVAGRSRIAEDGCSPAVMTVAARPGYRSNNIWHTGHAPAPVDAPDTVAGHRGVMPPAGGTVIRVIDYPPRPADPEERRRQASASLRELFPDAAHEHGAAQAGMHQTRSVDYAIVLSGTITSVQDHNETELSAGDILVQRGTNHAWENRSARMARVVYVLVDGR